MFEVAKVNRIHTRVAEEEVNVLEWRCDATDVTSLATFPDNVQSKKKKKLVMQLNIGGRKYR